MREPDHVRLAVLEAELKGLKSLLKERALRYSDSERHRDQRTEIAFDAAKEALGRAAIMDEKRFEGVNEFRKALEDYTRTLMPRMEAEQRFKDLTAKLEQGLATAGEKQDTQATFRDRTEGRDANKTQTWVIAGIVAALITALVALIRR